MNRVIVFDMNETLLDLGSLRRWFAERFDDAPDAGAWFSELLRLSFVSSVIDRYTPFTELAAAALETTALRRGITAHPSDLEAIKGILATLPPHPDVPEGLDMLVNAGYTLGALTNSPLATAHTQLDNAGITTYFSDIMSVEMVARFKPHRSVYLAAANALETEPGNLVMVAAHDWDIAGAQAAGLDGVFVERPGQAYSPAFPPPTVRVADIAKAAAMIIARYGPA